MSNENQTERLMYSPAEVAQLLSCSRSKVYEMVAEGLLPSLKLRGSVRIPAEPLREWVRAQTKTPEKAA